MVVNVTPSTQRVLFNTPMVDVSNTDDPREDDASSRQFVPSLMKLAEVHELAAVPTVGGVRTEAGHAKVRPPVPSWQMLKYTTRPSTALESVELVTFPVRVILK